MIQTTSWLRSNPFRLLEMIFKHGMDVRCTGTLLLYLLKSVFFLPAQIYEYLFLSRKINKHSINIAPVFIIGHFRSGTTLLHKLLAADPQFAYFKNSDLVLPGLKFRGSELLDSLLRKFIRYLKMPSFAYNKTSFHLEDPQEEDMCMVTSFARISYYWLFVFPKIGTKHFSRYTSLDSISDKRQWQKEYLYYLKRISLRNNGKCMLLKNPPNMARISAILELFPDAKFIFLYRDPKDVLHSTKRIWMVGAKQFSLQILEKHKINALIVDIYTRLHSKYELEKSMIPPKNLVEIKYEDLEHNPSSIVKEIYSKLSIPSENLNKITTRIRKESSYAKFNYEFDLDLSKKVDTELAKYSYQWNYPSPSK